MPKKTKKEIREAAKKRVKKLIPRVLKDAQAGLSNRQNAGQLAGVARAQGVSTPRITGSIARRRSQTATTEHTERRKKGKK